MFSSYFHHYQQISDNYPVRSVNKSDKYQDFSGWNTNIASNNTTIKGDIYQEHEHNIHLFLEILRERLSCERDSIGWDSSNPRPGLRGVVKHIKSWVLLSLHNNLTHKNGEEWSLQCTFSNSPAEQQLRTTYHDPSRWDFATIFYPEVTKPSLTPTFFSANILKLHDLCCQ